MGIVILTYCFISGFQAPIVRASIMASVAFGTHLTGRVYSAFPVLSLSALLMLIIVPSSITVVGFLLSFATTASLIFSGINLDSKLRFLPGLLRESLSISIAAQIGLAPIIYFVFGRVNVLSPLII